MADLNRLQYLACALFINHPDGKEFLQLMKLVHVDTPTFPQDQRVIDRHGGPLGWAGFREGQITLVRSLEELAENHLRRVEAENKKGNKA
jgi:hypothetical protein